MRVGVAISTTGDIHRIEFLQQAVAGWDAALPTGASLYVTVDGDEEATHRVEQAVSEWTGSVIRVGQPGPGWDSPLGVRDGRLGVAVSKNTGLEWLLDQGRCNWLFLSDDDAWPRETRSLSLHVNLGIPHSMVCWGRHRRNAYPVRPDCADWSWPRGSVLYVERHVVEDVGGMIEAFGPGGHEHVEWSRRIHQSGYTPVAYPSPREYVDANYLGAGAFWHCEDMQRPAEPFGNLRQRRRLITSIRRLPGDEAHADAIMVERDGNTAYVPFRADENRRQSATMTGT